MHTLSQNLRIVPRRGGGYLALSPEGDALQIGVAAATESDAVAAFAEAEAAWRRILEGVTREGVPASSVATSNSDASALAA